MENRLGYRSIVRLPIRHRGWIRSMGVISPMAFFISQMFSDCGLLALGRRFEAGMTAGEDKRLEHLNKETKNRYLTVREIQTK